MRFDRVDYPPDKDRTHQQTCFLVNDNWDDFTFKTSFSSLLFDESGVRHELGGVRILSRGLTSGRVPLPTHFNELNEDWCSLGMSREYYVILSQLSPVLRNNYLKSVRDCVFDRSIWEAFRDEPGMSKSLLRDVSMRDVLVNFPRILAGDARLTPYEFAFNFNAGGETEEKCEFTVVPDSKPPTNVHVLIGRNGVGKTRLLAGMADALTGNEDDTIGLAGQFEFNEVDHEANEFLNVAVVSYSAFDRFNPIVIGERRSEIAIPYYYVGIKQPILGTDPSEVTDDVSLKTPSDFNKEFYDALSSFTDEGGGSERLGGFRYARWRKALHTLRSDPGLAEFFDRFYASEHQSSPHEQAAQFAQLSSGHKIVLLTIARLVEYVSDRSLVLIDEPETHLHPPLLGSFVRAISELLISQNGVAIIATHSPVVLQEVPARCVTVVTRSGDRIRVRRPGIETFAENVGTLTRKVFGLEVQQSGFYQLLQKAADGREFDDVLADFEDEVGSEGRALARAFTTSESGE
jgi:ABC-type transport system involved in cytochrome c biogenesis ATPase subunit